MREQNVSIESAYPIKGTLAMPENERTSHPAILIISGTGQTDRDGNAKGLQADLYKELSHYLTSLGFATLRYDKRGVNESGGDYYETGLYDLIDDASECVRFLKSRPDIDSERIIILGHSEGALLGPAVHSKEPVSGLISIAGAAASMKEMLAYQSEFAFKEIDEAKGFKGLLFRLLKVSKKGRKQQEDIMKKVLESNEAVMKIKGAKFNAKWTREHFSYNVVDELSKVTVPLLSLTGDKDVQVKPEEARKIAELTNGEAEWHIIPNMNHILRKYDKDHTMLGLMKEYKALFDQPIDKDLLVHLEAWLKKYFID